jgi:antitoxin (DNA-binding transcriptional repressor) of toxin-antitoxin stability system
MYHMKRATLRDLRYKFSVVENLLEAGEEIEITRRKRVIARLLPPAKAGNTKRPDFIERLRRIYGTKRLKTSGADLLAEERARF